MSKLYKCPYCEAIKYYKYDTEDNEVTCTEMVAESPAVSDMNVWEYECGRVMELVEED